ncbi:YvrJ family protein [Clostridium sp. 'deep sea']
MLKSIGNFGFPIVITIYLLVRIEGKLEQLRLSLLELTESIRDLKYLKVD